MADSNRDINLRIRAKDYSSKTLKDLNKSINDLTKSQADQQKSASSGEASARSLEKSYQDLEKATKAAVRQAADIKSFENQSKALDSARAATASAQAAFQDYERTLKNTPKVTADQTKELSNLRKEMVQAEKNEERQSSRFDILSQRMKAYGVSTADTQGALTRLEQMVNKANNSLEKQEKAMADNERALKQLKKAQDDAAKQELAASIDRQRKALEAVANDAIAAANGWRTAATATREFGAAASPAATAINGILGVISPLGRSVKDVDANLRAMTSELNSSTGVINNTKEKVKELSEAQRQLSKAASLVDTFRQQMATLRSSRAEYSAAQKNVRELAAQLVGAGDGAKDIQQKLTSAQSTLAKSSKAFVDNANAARETRAQLNDLGVTTRSVSEAETQLVGVANQVTVAQQALTGAVGRSTAAGFASQAAAMQQVSVEARSMAVGMSNVASSTTPVSDAIRSIIAPANQANSTLSKMEQNAELMAASFSTIRKPVEDAAGKMKQLADAQEAIKKTSGLIDTFNQQKAAVGAARTEYKNAQQALKDLSAQAASGAMSESDYAAKTKAASAAVTAAAQAYRSEADAAKNTRAALQAAGVETRDLASAGDRLTTAAQNSAKAENELTNAIDKFGRASKTAFESAKTGAISVEGAISKVKNEIIGLTSAYTGLQGAMTLGNNVLDAAISKQQFMSQTAVAVGNNVKDQTAQWEYVTKLSEKWGLDANSAAKEYSRFLVSAVKSGGTVKDAEALFEDLAIIGRANNLTADQFNRMVYAVDQMLSQGQIMTAELKLQLGNVLPGIFEQAGIILNGSTEGFKEQLKKGFYGINAVYELFGKMSDQMIAAATKSASGLIAAQNRMKNANNEFNLEIGNSGFIDAYTNVIKKITGVLRSNDGKELAAQIGAAFTSAAEAALFLIKNLDIIIAAIKTLLAVMVGKAIINFGLSVKGIAVSMYEVSAAAIRGSASIGAWVTSMYGANLATKTLTVSMKVLGYAVPFLGWALLIYEFVAACYQASGAFRDFCWNSMTFWKGVIDYFYNMLTGSYDTFQNTMQKAKDWADENRSDEDKARLGIKPKPVQNGAMIKKDHSDLADDAVVYTENDKGELVKDEERAARITEKSDKSFDEWDQRKKRLITENQKLNEKIDKDTKSQNKKSVREQLDERIALVKEEYAPRLEEADAVVKSGKDKDARLTIEKTMNRAIELERKKFWNEIGKNEADQAAKRLEKIKELEDSIKQKRDEVDSASSTKNWSPENFDERALTYVESQVSKYKDLEAQIRKVGGADAERLQAELEGVKETAAANAMQTYQLAELERYNTVIKNIEDERNAKISVFKSQKEAYLISEVDYVNKVNEAYNDSKDTLLQAIDAANKFGEANRGAFKTDAEFAKWKANIQNTKTETQVAGNELNEYQKAAVNGLTQSVSTGFNSLVENITAVTQATETWKEAFENVGAAMLQYFAQLLQQIATTIIQAAIMRALLGGTGAATTAAAAPVASAGTNHNGGMAGSSGIGRQRVPMAAFANAQRYHTGGMVGFQPDEVPIIAQKGEEMLTRDDPRNRLNGGLNSSGGGDTKIIAVDDQRSAVTEALKTPEGQRAVITVLRSNLTKTRQMLG